MKILQSNPSLLGNFFHSFTIFSCLIFFFTVALYGSPEYSLFDSLWLQDGFCVSYKEIPYWNSHDLCLYGDVFFALLHGFVFMMTKNEPGMESCNEYQKYTPFAIFAHGLGHGALAAAMRDKPLDNISGLKHSERLNSQEYFVPYCVFWIFLMRAAMPKSSKFTIVISSIFAFAIQTRLDVKYDFTFVQTVLICCNGIDNLGSQSKKDFEYALFALMNAPIPLIGLVESLACSNTLFPYGGHIFYDYYIAISAIAFQLICWNRAKKNVKHLKSS